MSSSSSSFSNQLNGKAAGESSMHAEVNRLALLAMTKEQENKALKDRLQFLQEQAEVHSKTNRTVDVVNVSSFNIY